ncbi:MAG: NYN domain-containing protein [Deltaproteobacteria bacterium]|nr:NYN domain-containing protein [Deltaproteobacteria bacterium]
MRAAIFIDGGYLLKQVQDARLTPDYRNLAAYLLKPLRRNVQLDLMRCYFYYCPPWMSERPTEAELRRMAAHERFMAELQEQCDRWQVRLGKLERRRDGDKEVFAQKRVDVQLSVDMVQHAAAGHIQHAVLVAGDSDFIPAVIATKQSGATLTLWCDKDRSVHRDLILHADEVHYIDWRHFPGRRIQPPPVAPEPQPSVQPQQAEVGAVVPAELPVVSEDAGPSDAQEALQVEGGTRASGSGGRSRRRRGRRRGGSKPQDNQQSPEVPGGGESHREPTGPAAVVEVTTQPEPAAVVAVPAPSPSDPTLDVAAAVAPSPDAAEAPAAPRRRGGRGGRRRKSPAGSTGGNNSGNPDGNSSGTPPVAE